MNESNLFVDSSVSQLWFAVPLVLAISLVYGATRHELMGPILYHAVRTGAWIVAFMLIIAAVLFGFSWML